MQLGCQGHVVLEVFLNARLDEREALARAAVEGDGRWRYSEGGGDVMLVDGGYVAVGPWGCDIGEGYGRHIAANDPAFVLADIAAKRQIIELYRAVEDSRTAADAWVALKYVVRQLAVPFADHPDYREEWRP